MLHIELHRIVAMEDVKSGFSGDQYLLYLEGGSKLSLSKARWAVILEKWKAYCAEFPTHEPNGVESFA